MRVDILTASCERNSITRTGCVRFAESIPVGKFVGLAACRVNHSIRSYPAICSAESFGREVEQINLDLIYVVCYIAIL